MVDPQSALLSLGAIILVGLLGALIFRRAKISDVLFLIGAGILLGPVLRWLDVETFNVLVPTIATLTIIVIIFEAGLGLKLEHLARDGVRGLSLSLLAFLDSVVAAVLLMSLIVPWSLSTRVLFGVVIGSTGTAIVVSLVKGMRAGHRMRTLIFLETSLNDLFVIIGVVVLSTLMVAGHTAGGQVAFTVSRLFLIGILLGALVGVALVQTLGRLERHPSHYLLTMAVLLLLYIVVERLGGAGILAVLMVGIAIANAEVGTTTKSNPPPDSDAWTWSPLFHRDLQVLQGEVFFFLRAFFFVGLGVVFDLSLLTRDFLAVSALLTLALFAGRFVAVAVSMAGTRTPGRDILGMVILGPRGLSTAALASIPFLQFGLLETRQFPAYATAVVLMTNVLTTIGVLLRERALDPSAASHAKSPV